MKGWALQPAMLLCWHQGNMLAWHGDLSKGQFGFGAALPADSANHSDLHAKFYVMLLHCVNLLGGMVLILWCLLYIS